jgi:broad specificity phosphatase PhoE
VLDIADRDMDVPLSPLGREQAATFGRWLASLPPARQPDVVYASPYVRALDTARLVRDHAGLDVELRRDERLRERELGVLDLLTSRGVEARFPGEHARRQRLGKFYHRPPGGESWVDVALRMRSFRDSMALEHQDQRVLVVTHEVVITVVRYLLEQLDEQEALRLSREEPLANCSLTAFEQGDDGCLVLDCANWVVPLEQEGTAVTEDPDAQVAPR